MSKKRLRFSHISMLLALAVTGHATQAATFVVDTEADGTDATPGDGVCASFSGACTLRAAIQESNALVGADTITVPEGRYRPALGVNDEDAGAEGDFDIIDDLSIIGAGRDQTTIDGELGTFRVFDIREHPTNDALPTVALRAFTLRDGLHGSSSGSLVRNYGQLSLEDVLVTGGGDRAPAIYNYSGSSLQVEGSTFEKSCIAIEGHYSTMSISGSVFSENSCTIYNSAGAIEASNGKLVVSDSTFRENQGSGAGAIRSTALTHISGSNFVANRGGSGGALSLGGRYTVENSDFSENAATSSGGAIYVNSAGRGVIDNVDISANVARSYGGGVRLSSNNINYLSRLTLSDNRVTSGSGGGAYLSGRNIRLADARIEKNFATNYGGGVYVQGGVLIRNSLLTENQAREGGGLYSENDPDPSEIRNSTISGNTATYRGGGVYVQDRYANDSTNRLDLIYSTVANNSASDAGGGNIYRSEGRLRLRGTLVADPAQGVNCVGTVFTLGYNLSTDQSCALQGTEGDLEGVNAQLEALALNSASLQSHALTAGSPAIGMLPASLCADTDQRYHYRKSGSVCAVGAYEPGALKATAGEVDFSAAQYRVFESGVSQTLRVVRSGGSQGEVSVYVHDTLFGTAVPRTDYRLNGGNRSDDVAKTLSWADGEMGEKTLIVDLVDDRYTTGNMNVEFRLSALSGGLALGSQSRSDLLILDDETPQTGGGETDGDDTGGTGDTGGTTGTGDTGDTGGAGGAGDDAGDSGNGDTGSGSGSGNGTGGGTGSDGSSGSGGTNADPETPPVPTSSGGGGSLGWLLVSALLLARSRRVH